MTNKIDPQARKPAIWAQVFICLLMALLVPSQAVLASQGEYAVDVGHPTFVSPHTTPIAVHDLGRKPRL